MEYSNERPFDSVERKNNAKHTSIAGKHSAQVKVDVKETVVKP